MYKKIFFIISLIFCFFILFGDFITNNAYEEVITVFHYNFEFDRNSPIYKIIQKKIGINLKAISAPQSEWQNKLNIMLASGDIPDIFITFGPGDTDVFEPIAREGMLLPISKYYENYPNIKRQFVGREKQKFDGEYYAIPIKSTTEHTFMIQGHWLEELRLDIPRTISDLYNIAKIFKEKYNIYPISSGMPHTSGFFWLNPIFYAFGGGYDTWIYEDGLYTPSWISQGNKKGLKFINKLYHEKLIDPEFFFNTDDEKMEKFLSSKAGIVMNSMYSYFNSKLKLINKDAYIEIFEPIKGPNGEAGQWAMDGFWKAICINKNISPEKREKIFKLLDYINSEEGLELLRYGIKGTHWKEKNGEKIPLLPCKNSVYKRLREIDKTACLREFTELGDVWIPEWTSDYEKRIEILQNTQKYGRVDPFMYSKTKSQKKYGKQLYDFTMKEYVKLVRSNNFEADWKNYLNEYLRLGGEKIIKERN